MMILSYAPISTESSTTPVFKPVLLALKSLSQAGRLQLFLISSLRHGFQGADEVCKHLLDKVIWQTDVLHCSTGTVQRCLCTIKSAVRSCWDLLSFFLFISWIPTGGIFNYTVSSPNRNTIYIFEIVNIAYRLSKQQNNGDNTRLSISSL